jgi:outer membrane protein assembly factor BamB
VREVQAPSLTLGFLPISTTIERFVVYYWLTMLGSNHTRTALMFAAVIFGGFVARDTAGQNSTSPPQNNTSVHLRWGSRPGVSRYRLQLAHDRDFADIVFDRVVEGLESDINDLDPGRYFWRVAPLTAKLGDFSSAGVIDVKPPPVIRPGPSPAQVGASAKEISTGGGWRAAVGNISSAVSGHLRSPDKIDLVVMNAEGVVSALDATSGVALWSSRAPTQTTLRVTVPRNSILLVPDRSRLDNVVILAGALVVKIEGRTGRELWRATLPSAAVSGAVLTDGTGSQLVIIDNSRQRLFVVSDTDGSIASQPKLPARVIGAPMVYSDQGKAAFGLAYDSGDIEIRDAAGTVVRAANVNSFATTAPLFVPGRRGNLILVGTRDGLTALTAELRPLGRMAIPNDAPRGALLAQDLDGDGVPEIIMTTERRHLMAVNSTDGKILWDVVANDYGDALAFADINGDHVLDVFTEAGQRLAVALSGRDGTVIWKDDEATALATNHATTIESRGLVAVPFGAGVLLIGAEPSHNGLRAIGFPGR